MKPGCEVGHDGPAAMGHGHEVCAPVPRIGATFNEPRCLSSVDYARDVAGAELELATQFNGAELPIRSEVDPDEQVQRGRVVSGAGNCLTFDRTTQRDMRGQ